MNIKTQGQNETQTQDEAQTGWRMPSTQPRKRWAGPPKEYC